MTVLGCEQNDLFLVDGRGIQYSEHGRSKIHFLAAVASCSHNRRWSGSEPDTRNGKQSIGLTYRVVYYYYSPCTRFIHHATLMPPMLYLAFIYFWFNLHPREGNVLWFVGVRSFVRIGIYCLGVVLALK